MSEVHVTPGPGELSRIPFSAEAEGQIRSLAFWLTVVGWLNAIVAASDLLGLLLPHRNVGQAFDLILHSAIALWSFQAARGFRSVATTDVADQAYLVQAFTKLRSIFLLQGIVIIVSLAFLAAVALFLVLYTVAGR